MLNHKIKLKKSIKWIIEIFIWFLIFFVIANVILIIRSSYKSEFNTYQIFLPDVDGIIAGSPVNMMGIQIGYVKQVNIVDDEVYVKFTLNKKNFKIPKGSVVTVEFNGLGGSKSLEIYPPERTSGNNQEEFLIIHPPKRIHDSAGLMFEMFEKISDISYKFSYFAKQTTNVKIPGEVKEKDMTKTLKEYENWLDRTVKKIEEFNKK